MCGLCGVLDLGAGPVERRELTPMLQELELRGPDDEGLHLEPSIGLGHRRLSIIDVEGGHQPISSENGDAVGVCNGEIYNFRELRAELQAAGHVFRTRSDSEVIVHGYEEWGEGLAERLDGMFALAVWDRSARRLLLARDRFGKKPLIWFRNRGRFVFGSTMSAVLRHPAAPRCVDRDALARYLALEFVPAPQTIVEGIEKLPPGTVMQIDVSGEIKRRRYWTLQVRETLRTSEPEAAERLRTLLDAAVRKRLMSEVPLGVFLSGGIDSSAVVASAAALGVDPIRTFCIGFGERSFDESAHARAIAERYGTEHFEERLPASAMLEIVPKLGAILDEPMADASIVPTYLLCRMARQVVTVALSGDGGDELFGGYPTYLAHRLAGLAERLPASLLLRAERLAGRLPVSHSNISFDFKVKKTLEGLRYDPDVRNYVWLGAFAPDQLGELLTGPPPEPAHLLEPVRVAYREAAGERHLERVLSQDVALYLCGQILCKVDRASMANSLEVRAPFLDVELAEFVAALPLRMKLRGLRGKRLLRRALTERLPRRTLRRAKKGFGMPVAEWLRGPLRPIAADLFAGLAESGWFHEAALARLLEEHHRGIVDHRKRIWALMIFELWRRQHLASTRP